MISEQPLIVGMTSHLSLAQALVDRLVDVGVRATVEKGEVADGTVYSVFVPQTQRRLAEKVAADYCPLCEMFDISS